MKISQNAFSYRTPPVVMINRCYDLSLGGIEAASNCNKTIWVGQNRFILLFMILKMYSAEDHFSKVGSKKKNENSI